MLRGIAAALFEDEGEEPHRRQSKWFSISPVWLREGTSFPADEFQLSFAEHIDDVEVIERFLRRISAGIRLGRHGSAELIDLVHESRSWADLADGGATGVTVEFASPTCFSRDGKAFLLPDPNVVVASLASRWNRCAERAGAPSCPNDIIDQIRQNVILTEHDTSGVFGGRTDDSGFTGWARFSLLSGATSIGQQWWYALWSLAEITGLGAGGTSGLGRIDIHFDHD